MKGTGARMLPARKGEAAEASRLLIAARASVRCGVYDASRIARAGSVPMDAAIVGTHDVNSAPGVPVAQA
jgi:hypothetical protein